MRLTAIKLAGFKSFVDPVQIPIIGQIVGVVGPNGCGKSNVIDAIRWVLGESQAKQLRGASMADVIFNGSATRKAVSRASVELSFDNSDGKAPGQWSQYAEISVKRVLTRQGESNYYINNMQVRRRDMVDIFLGTGLGSKTSYAIIEQGMIARIIEAKPEELRGFLEEAAGISKYKERRRETETRLQGTRENLLRLDDIRRELDEQIERLRSQAEVAQAYQRLQAELKAAQQLLWFVKKRDALEKRHHFDRQISQAEQQLTLQTDTLRGIEYQLDAGRSAHAHANTVLNEAQGGFYAAVAEVSRLEQAVRHLADTRQRLQTQVEHIDQQQQRLTQQQQNLQSGLTERQQRLQVAESTSSATATALAAIAGILPQLDAVQRDSRQRRAVWQRELSAAEQAGQVNQAHLQHARKTLQQLAARQIRLQQEQDGLPDTDPAIIAAMVQTRDEITVLRDNLSGRIEASQTILHNLEAQRQPWRVQLEQHTRGLHQAEGELAGLSKIQQQLNQNINLDDWLAQRELSHLPRLWQQIEVANGWEIAVEVVLRLRMQAIAINSAAFDHSDVPAGELGLFAVDAAQTSLSLLALPHLLEKISFKSGLGGALQDWLSHVYIAENAAAALALRTQLPPGGQILTAEGHIYTRHSVHYHAQADQTAGILARQKEIERLIVGVAAINAQKLAAATQLNSMEAEIQRNQQDLSRLRAQLNQTQQQFHQHQLDSAKLQQTQERIQQRRAQIGAELNEINALIQLEQNQQNDAETHYQQHQQLAAQLRRSLDDDRQTQQSTEAEFNQKRETHRQLERKLQEAQFSAQLEQSKINDIGNEIKVNNEQQQHLLAQQANLLNELNTLNDANEPSALSAALAQRQQAEAVLALSRQQLEQANTQLRQQDEARMTLEQALPPLRNQLETLRLKRQEAALLEVQCEQQLLALHADQSELIKRLSGEVKNSGLNQEIERLSLAIEAYGAVNLVAVQELERAVERASYLQAQTEDLEQAIATLIAVMATIDGETRDLLKSTFDVVNRSMAELFTLLFDGGHAELILSGEELLDAGVQVFAQPPGKKNSSIQLLSGGEKALTALSLVFALFKLTPAPFCLLDEVDAPLDDTNTERYVRLIKQMSAQVQFIFITHNRLTMEAAEQLIGVTMQESGVSRIVSVDLGACLT